MTFLLDVNVLIALIDPAHIAHDAAHRWFEREGARSWATCPITENGVLRILGNPRYPNTPGSPAIVAGILTALRNLSGHHFWADELSLIDNPIVRSEGLLSSPQITDTYLLALASAKGGQLATFDRKLATAAIAGGQSALQQIPTLE